MSIMSRFKNFVRNINYLSKHSLWDQREEDIVYLTNKILDDGMYEYGVEIEGIPKLKILDVRQSMELLKKNPKSFVRTSDGEIKIMIGMDQPFQRYEKEIAERLLALLSEPNDKLYVAINRNYFNPMITDGNHPYYRRNAYEFRNFYLRHCNPQIEFIDGNLTYFRFGYEDVRPIETEWLFNEWRDMFKEHDLVIVCGDGILDKLEFDLFETARSKTFIYGPRRHAWDEHDRLISKICEIADKSAIIIFILGMAGKAMIPELTELGYMCWDIGHLAKSYDTYMRGVPGTKENVAKFYAPD